MALGSALDETVEKERRLPEEPIDLRKPPPDAPFQTAVEVSEPFSPGRHAILSFQTRETVGSHGWSRQGLLQETALSGVLILMTGS